MRGIGAWIVLRTILVSDALLLVVVGFICIVWFSDPAGPVAAVASWLAAGLLFGLLPLTDPYRVLDRRRRRLDRVRDAGPSDRGRRPPSPSDRFS